jgi:5S rRNA maturation endonuclease (ribonuclease M5)
MAIMANSEALKTTTNLREVVRVLWGKPQQTRQQYDVYASRWRDDGQKPAFTVYDTYFKDYGGEGISGDVYIFLQNELNCDFKEALEWLANYHGESTLPVQAASAKDIQKTTAKDNPAPAKDWQDAAKAILKQSQAYLWSDTADAHKALNYLREIRGLSDESIRKAGYGYNPSWQKINWIQPQTNKQAALAPGIIEPWYYDGNLWALRIRCRVGNLAEALDIPDDIIGENPSPKYLNLAGSKQNGALYNGDAIRADREVVIVEGGFDAILAQQILGEAYTVVTFGSVSNKPNQKHLEKLKQAPSINLLLDNDRVGQQAQEKLYEEINKVTKAGAYNACKIVRFMQGKDISDFVTKHQGDLLTLVQSATKPAWWENGIPDTVRSALLTYFRPSTAPVIEMINTAVRQGLLDSQCFSIYDLIAANIQTSFAISEGTLRRIISELTGSFFSELDTDKLPNYVSKIEKKGRDQIYYALKSRETILQTIINRAVPRIYEKYHPVEGQESVVARPTRGMLETLGFSDEEAVRLIRVLDRVYQDVYEAQGQMQERTSKRAYGALQRLLVSLDNPHSSVLPEKWSLSNVTNYRAAFLRATNNPDERRSRRSICDLLGIANGSVDKMIKLAGLERTHEGGEYEIETLNTAHKLEKQVRELCYEVKGYPRSLIISDEEGQVEEHFYRGAESQSYVEEQLANGYNVAVKLQVANHYSEYTQEMPMSAEQKPKKSVSQPESTSKEAESSQEKAPSKRAKPKKLPKYYGPGFNEEWVRRQFLLALIRKGRLQEHGDGWVDTETGEVFEELDSHELLAMLLGPDFMG